MMFLSRLTQRGVSQTSLVGLENGVHTLAVSWVAALPRLPAAMAAAPKLPKVLPPR